MNLKRIKQIIDRWDPVNLLSHAGVRTGSQ